MNKEVRIQAEIIASAAWKEFDKNNPNHVSNETPVYHPGISAEESINYRTNIRSILEFAAGTFVFTGLHLLSRKFEIENELVIIAGIVIAAPLINIAAPTAIKSIVNRFRQS